MQLILPKRKSRALRVCAVAAALALGFTAATVTPASAATTLNCPKPAAAAPEALNYPTADSSARVKLGADAVKAFAGITIPQAVVNDPVTGNALIAYYTPGDYPSPAVAEVRSDGTVVSQSLLRDGNGGNSLDLYRVGNLDDSQNSLAISIDKKGYVHVAGNMRTYRPMGYWRSAEPHTVGSMLHKSQLPGLAYNANGISLFATGAERVSSSPMFFRPANGELYFGFTHYEPGQGNFFLLHYDADTQKWDNPSGGTDTTYGFVDQHVPLLDGYNDSMSPFVQPIVTGPDGWYWLTWSWRDDAMNVDTASRIQVMKTKDFRTWYTGRGAALPSSIVYSWQDTGTNVPTGLEVASMPKAGAGFVNNQNFLGFAGDGTPVMVYFRADNGRTTVRIDKLGSLGTWLSATPLSMSGLYDLAGGANNGTLSISGPPVAVPGSTDILVNYTCNAVDLQARVGLNSIGTYGSPISTDYQRSASLPRAATQNDPESAGMSVVSRTAVSAPFTGADGKTRVWAVKWDAGPYAGLGAKPSGNYPVGGSAMTLYSYVPAG